MDAQKFLSLSKKYSTCPKCGNNAIGNGEGILTVIKETFIRSCKCGWKAIVKEKKK